MSPLPALNVPTTKFVCILIYHNSLQHSEMYPECVIASWDALILLLDAGNIERRVQLDAEKNRMFMQITNSRKKQRHNLHVFQPAKGQGPIEY